MKLRVWIKFPYWWKQQQNSFWVYPNWSGYSCRTRLLHLHLIMIHTPRDLTQISAEEDILHSDPRFSKIYCVIQLIQGLSLSWRDWFLLQLRSHEWLYARFTFIICWALCKSAFELYQLSTNEVTLIRLFAWAGQTAASCDMLVTLLQPVTLSGQEVTHINWEQLWAHCWVGAVTDGPVPIGEMQENLDETHGHKCFDIPSAQIFIGALQLLRWEFTVDT